MRSTEECGVCAEPEWSRDQPTEPGWYWFYGYWADGVPEPYINRDEHERWFSIVLVTRHGSMVSRQLFPRRASHWPAFFDGYFIRTVAPEPPEPHYPPEQAAS